METATGQNREMSSGPAQDEMEEKEAGKSKDQQESHFPEGAEGGTWTKERMANSDFRMMRV